MDIVGKRGEALFRAIITKWCDGEQWLEENFLGEKAEGLDFEVRLLGSPVFHANFYVQVKATAKPTRYSGSGKRRRLLVRLEPDDAVKIGTMKAPAYVVGIDVLAGKAYIRHVPAGATRGFAGISTRHPLNCKTIKQLWNEVQDFWDTRPAGMSGSSF
jgi:hypothetical protein